MPVKPMLHQTDLFRPPIDPDDHWDLACVYALAAKGDVDLGGILLDYPPETYPGRSPDVCGIAQLGFLTGITAPFAVGSSMPFSTPAEDQRELSRRERAGADFVLAFLRHAESPAIINIVGSCRDVALAAAIDPDLFAAKCAGIYLNAGNGAPDPSLIKQREYNVVLNPEAYAAIFRIPCRIYWMPCFETGGEESGGTFATWYRFRQDEILPALSPQLRGYFTYSLGARLDTRYLRYVVEPESDALSPHTARNIRHMWCTAGFLHAAGYTVTRDGEIVPLAEADERAVYEFCSIAMTCDENGDTRWRFDESARDRYIFRVKDIDAYPSAMTVALRTLLTEL